MQSTPFCGFCSLGKMITAKPGKTPIQVKVQVRSWRNIELQRLP
uniref:Protein activator of interferon induced protein kinase EIF2AK2 n=1 Tax=Homo sapiens TaxID=9606 RepID=A0A7I2YQP2_HUMAN